MPQVIFTKAPLNIDIKYTEDEQELAARAAALLGLEVDEVDPDMFWCCPGCNQISTYNGALYDMPMNWGSSFETHCPHCRLSFAPKKLDDGSDNPILHPCYTHEEIDDEEPA